MQAKKQSRNLSVPQTGFGQNWDCMHGKHELTIPLMHDICSSAMAIVLEGKQTQWASISSAQQGAPV